MSACANIFRIDSDSVKIGSAIHIGSARAGESVKKNQKRPIKSWFLTSENQDPI
jgi:hypothetical protein